MTQLYMSTPAMTYLLSQPIVEKKEKISPISGKDHINEYVKIIKPPHKSCKEILKEFHKEGNFGENKGMTSKWSLKSQMLGPAPRRHMLSNKNFSGKHKLPPYELPSHQRGPWKSKAI